MVFLCLKYFYNLYFMDFLNHRGWKLYPNSMVFLMEGEYEGVKDHT